MSLGPTALLKLSLCLISTQLSKGEIFVDPIQFHLFIRFETVDLFLKELNIAKKFLNFTGHLRTICLLKM